VASKVLRFRFEISLTLLSDAFASPDEKLAVKADPFDASQRMELPSD
jgi:hypothetical protein